MFKFPRQRKTMPTDVSDKNLEIISRVPAKYSDEDWDLNNKMKFQISDDQQKLAERILAESKRMVDETRDTTKSWKSEVDHHLRERASEIRFLVDELNKQKKTGLLEEEALKTYKMRIMNAIDFLREKSLSICQRCIIYREGRLGPDLCDDEVDRQLRQELKVIKGCQGLMDKTLSETGEQIRRLKATIYLLDRDLSNKDRSLKIDEVNLSLRANQQEMCVYTGSVPLDKCDYTLSEWEHTTYKNIENTAKELNSAAQLRAYVDLLLKQVVEDLENQRNRTNEAFMRRIGETKKIKENLQATHNDTLNHINEVNRNLTHLEKELADKEGFLALCQMRLGNRAQRPGIEMTCDAVQDSLYKELSALKETVAKLNQKISENKASLRYLLQAQVMQEEEINVKANTLKIDDVNCMTLRQGLHYQSF